MKKVQEQSKSVERNSNIELLRIIAMIMIVVSHMRYFMQGLDESILSNSFSINFVRIVGDFGQVGVTLFILISGYFLCQKKFKLSSIIKLLFEIIFYAILINIVGIIVGIEDYSLQSLLKWITLIFSGEWWFISVYIALYLIYPFLNKCIEKISKQQFLYLLSILFIFVSVMPSFEKIDYFFNLFTNLLFFIFIYFIGAYIRLYSEDFKFLHCMIGFLICVGIFIVGILFFGINDFKHNMYIIGISVFTFGMFININFKSKIINIIGSTTFGVYLLHENDIVRYWLWKDVFKLQNYINSNEFAFRYIGALVLVFLVCLLIDFLRKTLLEKYIFNRLKIMDKLDQKASVFFPDVELQRDNNETKNFNLVLILIICNLIYFAFMPIAYYINLTLAYLLFILTSFIIILIYRAFFKTNK